MKKAYPDRARCRPQPDMIARWAAEPHEWRLFGLGLPIQPAVEWNGHAVMQTGSCVTQGRPDWALWPDWRVPHCFLLVTPAQAGGAFQQSGGWSSSAFALD